MFFDRSRFVETSRWIKPNATISNGVIAISGGKYTLRVRKEGKSTQEIELSISEVLDQLRFIEMRIIKFYLKEAITELREARRMKKYLRQSTKE